MSIWPKDLKVLEYGIRIFSNLTIFTIRTILCLCIQVLSTFVLFIKNIDIAYVFLPYRLMITFTFNSLELMPWRETL
jgi:hypothetical protein